MLRTHRRKRDVCATRAAENLIAVLEGRRAPNVVNPEVYK
jgi:hypothetical protein